MSKESLLLLKEKILEMQKGMEYLSIKERDYEDLQNLAEEEAETICQLEKENYKLKLALSSIESRWLKCLNLHSRCAFFPISIKTIQYNTDKQQAQKSSQPAVYILY